MNCLNNQEKQVTYDLATQEMRDRPIVDASTAIKPFGFTGFAGRFSYPHTNDDFE